MKKRTYILAASLLMAAGAQAANIQASDGEWTDTSTWSTAYLPGDNGVVDGAIIASGDNVTVTSEATYVTNSVNLVNRAGGTMDVNADMTVFRNMSIGDHASTGATVTHSAGTIDHLNGFFILGSQSTTISTYTMSGTSALGFNGTMAIGPNGLLKIVGENVMISAGNTAGVDHLTMTGAGELEFVLGEGGASSFNVAGNLIVDAVNSQLTVDGSGYTGGNADITLVNAAAMADTFAVGKYSVTGMGDEGTDWTLTQGTNGDVVLNVIPEPAALGLIAVAGAGLFFIRRFMQI